MHNSLVFGIVSSMRYTGMQMNILKAIQYECTLPMFNLKQYIPLIACMRIIQQDFRKLKIAIHVATFPATVGGIQSRRF